MNLKRENAVQSASVAQFLQEAVVYLGNEQQELARLRRETYIYSYGSIIAPIGLTLLTRKRTEVVDMMLFLGAPSLLRLMPDNVQKALSVAMVAYNMYKHSASTVGTALFGWIITKIINQLPWQNDNNMIRDEVKALLLLLTDVCLPRARIMMAADHAVESGLNKQFSFYKPSIPPRNGITPSPNKAASVGTDIKKDSNLHLKQLSGHASSPQSQVEVVVSQNMDSKIDDTNISTQPASKSHDSASQNYSQPMTSKHQWTNRSRTDREWSIHRKALEASSAVYDDKTPRNCDLCKDLSFNGFLSGLKVNGYQDAQSGILFLAFKGTSLTDRRDIASDILLTIMGKPPAATHNLVRAIRAWQKNHPGTQIILTGHSLGASLASYVSAKTQLPAIVFENPGLRGSRYALENVISYQSRRNGINQMNQYIHDNGGEQAQYGQKIRLPFPSDTHRIISSIPLLGGAFSHIRSYLAEAFDKHMADRRTRGLGPCGHETYQYHLTETLPQTVAAPRV